MAKQEGEKRGPGRPPGEESPEILTRKLLLMELKSYRSLSDEFDRRAKGETPKMPHLTIDDIGKMMEIRRKSIADLQKSVLAPAKATGEKVQEEQSGEELLREMLEGKERG